MKQLFFEREKSETSFILDGCRYTTIEKAMRYENLISIALY